MSTVRWGTRTTRRIAGVLREKRTPTSLDRVDYGGSRDGYARLWERFLSHLGYEVLELDTKSIPRDCVWVARAPERAHI